jgi:Ala-tRNA(Pro) deacylase
LCIAPDSMNTQGRLYADLNALEIAYTVTEHEAVFTVEQSQRVDRDLPGSHTKNLFLKDASGQFWLVTVPAQARVDLKALPSFIGRKRVSFGKAEDMERLLGVTPGSVTPLAAINDVGGDVRIVLEQSLASAEQINVHPLRNTATMTLASAGLVRALVSWGHGPLIAAIPILETA